MIKKENYLFEDLIEILKILRSDNGCPWDRVQTHESLKKDLLEEAYETIETIDEKDYIKLSDELGDVLLQVVFHSQIGKEENTFDIQNVLNNICNKMISRHTHVFADTKLDTPNEVLDNWEKIKNNERDIKSYGESLEDVTKTLPALMRSQKIQKKAAKAGFDWDHIDDVFDKVHEEIEEIRQEIKNSEKEKIDEEVGDLLFACVNLSRFLNVNAELSLMKANNKFIDRFKKMENLILADNKDISGMSLGELDEFWNKVKKNENK